MIDEMSFELLAHLNKVETWILSGDERGKAYLDRGIARFTPEGRVEFNKQKAIESFAAIPGMD